MAVNKFYKVGDKIRVKNNKYSNYSLKAGDTAEVSFITGATIVQVDVPNYGAVNLNNMDIEKAYFSKAELEKQVVDAELLVKIAKDKLAWLKETKSEIFDEDEFKVWQVLKTLDSKTTLMQKTKAIAALIKS